MEADTKKHLVFIMNPISGTRKKERVPQLAEELLDKTQFTHTFALTERPLHATELARAAAEAGAYAVIAVGGDGTVNEVASGLMHSKTALGIIPFGSGNGLARHLGIPISTVEAIRLLNQPHTTLIDGALANGRPFFCTAGLGFDAHIGRLFASAGQRGFGSYVRLSLQEYFTYSPQRYSLEVDGRTFRRKCFVVSLANAGQYGNNAYISPEADIQDGKIDLCLLKPFPAVQALPMGMRLFQGSIHESPYMEIIRAVHIRIQSPKSECMHLDGEFLPFEGVLEVKAVPACLQVITPVADKRVIMC
ncbi:diacylglycerol/lipid kinase family protein [Cesiribacter andamanensis]|uniref:diacylglycerol/lipid kinase family protein n=1 Tax=Cesiribacter andamanensis TaxID=649507 RepID=UPI000349A9C6|nr:YegS/Rv2252/BmrU family lipid kinase [Cesiribacter andamanensis]